MIDKATVQKITDAADIVEVVSDYVHLIKRGRNYVGLCPFHNEKTPSFSVNSVRNFCYCFSCKKGGSPVNFIMEKEGLSYHDALLHLAQKYGIKVEEKELSEDEKRQLNERESLLVANEWAANKIEKALLDTEEGRNIGLQYLYQRGVTPEAIKKFRLGYNLDSGHSLADAAKLDGMDLKSLAEVGVLGMSQKIADSYYDRFRGRVIFPVLNPSGKVVAFGGRDLKGGMAKYINSPESAIYKKSNELYGIYQAKSEIAKQDNCFLVEGYMDVIGMWQSGMENVVASSGTALTDGQIAMIHRFTDNITLIYDGDAAGIKASLRGIDMLLAHKMNVKVLLLPDGHDPDSFARENTPEKFREYVKLHATDIIRFKAQVLLKDVGDDPQKRVAAIESVVSSLAHIPDKVKRNVYIQECSRILGVREEVIEGAVEKSRGFVMEQQKRQRQSTEIDRLDQNENNPQPDLSKQLRPSKGREITEMYPYYPFERNVVYHCVRYGIIDFCESEFEDGTHDMLTVAEYVAEELQEDNIWFSFPAFAKTFNRILDLKEDFQNDNVTFNVNLEKEKKEMLKAGYDEIAAKDLNMEDIRRAEHLLEDRINEELAQRRFEFARYYVEQKLSSHHDDDVRRTVTEAMNDEPPLSNIYIRNNPISERKMEIDRMKMLVPRGVLEWKNEMLNQMIRAKMRQLDNIIGRASPEEEQKILMETQALMEKRGQLGKVMGDRTIGKKIK
ncbi:MAG: DNA primase [Muribaculaceae bacterium]|nr:DNA primase [Muribaculaceae bacterium]MDE6522718.1 DNA primase [Muribaculaceae bacterium]